MGKRIPNAEIRRVWLDPALTTAQAAAQVGLTRANLWHRAKALGLPPRARGRRAVIPAAELAAMWNAGVLAREIAAKWGCHPLTVCASARRLGLTRRPLGSRPAVSMEDFQEQMLGEALAATAAQETARRRALDTAW